MENKVVYFISVLFCIGLVLIAIGVAWWMSIDFGMCSPQFLLALGCVIIGFCFAAFLILGGLHSW